LGPPSDEVIAGVLTGSATFISLTATFFSVVIRPAVGHEAVDERSVWSKALPLSCRLGKPRLDEKRGFLIAICIRMMMEEDLRGE
jgi:hypothetical protein